MIGILSKKLATINTDCDVIFNESDYELKMPDGEKVQQIFEDLEFRRMKEQFLKLFSAEEIKSQGRLNSSIKIDEIISEQKGTAGSGQFSLFGGDSEPTQTIKDYSSRSTIENTPHFYQTILPGIGKNLFLQNLVKQESVCFDTQTTSADCLEAELVGISFSWEKGKGFYLPFPENKMEAQLLIEELRPFFENENTEKIGQNLKNDLKMLAKYDITVKGKLFDTMLAHYLINADMRHDLHVLSETYLNYTPISLEEVIGKKGKNQQTLREAEIEKQTEYAVENSDIIFQLKQHFQNELGEANTQKLFDEIEIPLLRVLADMELEGINLDKDFLNSLSEALDADILQLEKDIYEEAGEEFNIASPKQLGDILFGKLKLIAKPKKTRTGQFSTAEDVLSVLAKDHKIIRDVLEYRGLAKLKSRS